MSTEKLQGLVTKLRAEVGRLAGADAEAHARLTQLIAELETQIADAGERATTTSAPDLRHYIEQFEVDHPRVTTILNEIMVTLSNLGI